MARGALATDPRGVRLSPGVYRNAQGKTYQSATGALGRDPKPKKTVKQLEGAPAQVAPSGNIDPQNPTTGMGMNEGFNDAMTRGFDQFGNMGSFDPQLAPMPEMPQADYTAMRQRAEQAAMDSFERNMGPQQQREEAAFRNRMAEQGVPETSEGYQRQYADMKAQQNAARQNAATAAFQAGQGEQAQAYGQQAQNYQLGMAGRDQQFNQGLQQYRLPMEQLNTLAPYYNTNFQGQQAGLDRQWQEQMAQRQNRWDRQNMRLQYNLANSGRSGGGRGGSGGGGGNPAGQYDRTFDNMMLQYMTQPQQQQPQYPGYAGGFFQGFGQGTPMGLMSGLKGGS